MPWREINAMDQKMEFIILWKSQQFTVTELSELFTISRTTAYKFLDRFARQGYKALAEENKNPHNHPNKTPKGNRILKENDLINKRRRHKKVEMQEPIFDPEASNEVWSADLKVRYLCRNRAIRIGKANWIFVSTALMGKNLGLEELGNGIFRMYYRDFFLGYLDEKEIKVSDILDYNYDIRV